MLKLPEKVLAGKANAALLMLPDVGNVRLVPDAGMAWAVLVDDVLGVDELPPQPAAMPATRISAGQNEKRAFISRVVSYSAWKSKIEILPALLS